MSDYQAAVEKILQHTSALPAEELSLNKILGRGLAEAIIAPFDQPRFDNSAVDGYGVRVSDLSKADKTTVKLKLVGVVKPGNNSGLTLVAGEAVKLLTGAKIPTGVEAVVMREFCTEKENTVMVHKSVVLGENIRTRAVEFTAGTTIMSAGERITPPVIGLLASLGYAKFLVGSKPSVGIVITGDELVLPGEPVLEGQIYDANTYSLEAAINAFGIEEVVSERAADQYEQIKEVFRKMLAEVNLIISSGGVSVGDFDYVKDVLQELGVQTVFWQIAVKPGRPVYFGVYKSKDGQNKLIFGLPGNTVSALVTFHQFVKPAILKMMSINNEAAPNKKLFAVIDKTIRKRVGRLDLMRAKLASGKDGLSRVMPKNEQESHMLSGLALADSLIHFPAEDETIEAGKTVQVEKLSWFD